MGRRGGDPGYGHRSGIENRTRTRTQAAAGTRTPTRIRVGAREPGDRYVEDRPGRRFTITQSSTSTASLSTSTKRGRFCPQMNADHRSLRVDGAPWPMLDCPPPNLRHLRTLFPDVNLCEVNDSLVFC